MVVAGSNSPSAAAGLEGPIARTFSGRKRNFSGENFWARGYFVSTVGLDEAVIRAYIRDQEKEDERYEQLRLGEMGQPPSAHELAPLRG